MLLNKAYYFMKPVLPLPLRLAMRRLQASLKRSSVRDVWPIDPKAGVTPPNWPGWPGGKSFALVLTHDVEARKGLSRVEKLAELEIRCGFYSSFNFVPEGDYQVPDSLRRRLGQAGFEVGVHGLYHDGKLYNSKAGFAARAARIRVELCSFTNLAELKNKGPYDLIFSNFAGLNCTDELHKVLAKLPGLLKPNGMITLVVLPKFCLWETLLIFKGKLRTGFRRFFSRRGRRARVEGTYFKCWYYNPSYIINRLKNEFDLLGLEGLCSIVPPSYMEGFAEKHPSTYKFLRRKENHLKSKWPWRLIGDYYIVSMRKKSSYRGCSTKQ